MFGPWLLLAASMQFDFGRQLHQERFPAPFKLWRALFMLLSVVAVGVHTVACLDGLSCSAGRGRSTPSLLL
jgi:hypothetical protein